jgi:predicted RNA-binding Zn ribbon-like protein
VAKSPIGQAPGDLAILQAFVNTRDIEAGSHELASPPDLDRWLAEHGLTAPDGGHEPVSADLSQALELREALRATLKSHLRQVDAAGAAPARFAPANEPDPAVRLGGLVSNWPVLLRASPDGVVRLAPAAPRGVAAGLTRLLLIAAEAATLGTWPRLKVCSSDDCQWAFYDRSPTRNGCWCSMQICGSRAKSRAYRARQAT